MEQIIITRNNLDKVVFNLDWDTTCSTRPDKDTPKENKTKTNLKVKLSNEPGKNVLLKAVDGYTIDWQAAARRKATDNKNPVAIPTTAVHIPGANTVSVDDMSNEAIVSAISDERAAELEEMLAARRKNK